MFFLFGRTPQQSPIKGTSALALSTEGYMLHHLCSCCRNAATYKWKYDTVMCFSQLHEKT